MKIKANREWHPACLIYANAFENMWRRNHLFIHKWEGEPAREWFSYKRTKESRGTEREGFVTSDISIESDENGHYIYFVNGRHRMRWLLQSGANVIPVGIYEEHIDLAHELGLLVKRVGDTDTFELA